MSSKLSLDQHVKLTEEEDLRSLIMIGGIEIPLPLSSKEAEICVADEAATKEE